MSIVNEEQMKTLSLVAQTHHSKINFSHAFLMLEFLGRLCIIFGGYVSLYLLTVSEFDGLALGHEF